MLPFFKAHAYGNDFLYVEEAAASGRDHAALARAICERHAGVGADGLILYRPTPGGAAMRLFNADGSYSEVSGNGVRALGAVVLAAGGDGRTSLVIETDAGEKRLDLLRRDAARLTFRAAMGHPEAIAERTLEVGGEALRVVTLRVGNPQCVAVEAALSLERMHRLGALLEHHEAFPEGTNVEFATVESPSRVRILIWERGVGPTLASGTGACASAVAAAACGGASRDVEVASPGGTQRVEWTDAGLFLTGWAEVLCRGTWLLITDDSRRSVVVLFAGARGTGVVLPRPIVMQFLRSRRAGAQRPRRGFGGGGGSGFAASTPATRADRPSSACLAAG